MSKAKNWVFTLNNYDGDALLSYSEHYSRGGVKYIIYGREVGDSGTPHLQGFISFEARRSLQQVKEFLGGNPHVEVCRNTPASINYCKKDGDFEEYGELIINGRRSELDAFKASVKEGVVDMKALREIHSNVCARYPRFVLEYVKDHEPLKGVEDHELRDWQAEAAKILEGEPDDRTVNFVVDHSGNSGKTWFAHWYCSKHPDAQVIVPGKKQDMAYCLDPTMRVYFVDAPRSKQGEYIQYDFLEEIKNGFVFSPKYESTVKRIQRCHLFVMMNEQPDMHKLSEDRYNIINTA